MASTAPPGAAPPGAPPRVAVSPPSAPPRVEIPSPVAVPPPAAVAPVAPPAGDLPSLWNAVLESLANRPSMSWLKSLSPLELTETTLRLVTQPGHRQMLAFVTDARKDQLRDLLTTILGRRVKVELTVPAAGGGDATTEQAASGGESRGAATTNAQRRDAMALPLVRQVIDLFDATLTDVKNETEGENENV